MASSSLSSLPPTEKSVYFRAISHDSEIAWYSFPLNGPPNKPDKKRKRGLPFLTPLNRQTTRYLFSTSAVVDSTIYSIGGHTTDINTASWKVYRRVRRWDTSRVEESWERCSSMGGARFRPQVVTLNGMIYVMGGFGSEDGGPHPWAEVFDPKSGSWSSLNPPCLKPSIREAFSTALPSTNQVLVGSTQDEFVCLYDVELKKWEQLHHEIDCAPSSDDHPLVAGTTLFWFRYGMLHAYDLVGKWNYSAPIRGLDDVVPLELFEPNSDCSSPTMLRLSDNNFCLVFCDYLNSKKRLDLLYCIRISVSPVIVRGRKAHFDAIVASSQAHFINAPREIRDVVLVDAGVSPTEEL